MIKIIKGKYGHYIPNDAGDLSKGGRTVPITPDSGSISLSTEQEKRLVERGVAKYVDAVAQPAPATTSTLPAGQDETGDPAYSKEMKLEELKGIAVSGYNCDPEVIKKLGSKDKVIAAIEQAKAGQEDDEEEGGGSEPLAGAGGEQPNLQPEEPVQ